MTVLIQFRHSTQKLEIGFSSVEYLNLADDDSGIFRTNALDRGGQYEGDSHVKIRPPSDPTNVFTGESWWIGHQRGDGSGNTYGYIKGDRISDDIDYKDINNYNNLIIFISRKRRISYRA